MTRNGVWLSTFHSLCARLLRREAPHIGLVARFRDLRLVRPGLGRQAGASASSGSTTSWCRRGRRWRASARPRTGWKDPTSLRGAWNLRDEQIAKIYENYLARSGQQRARLRRPAAEDRRALRDSEQRASDTRSKFQLRDGRRVPGHQPAAVPAHPAARRDPPQSRASSAIPISRSTSGAAPTCATSSTSSTTSPRRERRPPRAELSLDAGDPRRRDRGHPAEPQPQGQAPLDRPQRRRARSSISAAATSSKRPTSSPARSSRRAPKTSTA